MSSEEWEDDDPLPMAMTSDSSKKVTKSDKSDKPQESSRSKKSEKSVKSSKASKSSRHESSTSSKESTTESESSYQQSSSSLKQTNRPDLDDIVKHNEPLSPEKAARANIQIALSGSKLVFTSDGIWRDASDQTELENAVHPILAENIALKKRAELLVKLVAESEYENQQIVGEIKECDEVIKQLRKMLGEQAEEEDKSEEEEEGNETEGDSF